MKRIEVMKANQEKSKQCRNRSKTTLRIIDALEEVIAERGVAGIGINRIAERAGVSKVLIYRYFGGLSGLVKYYIKMGRLFPLYPDITIEQLRPDSEQDVARIWYRQITHLYRLLRTNQPGYEVIKATVQDDDPLADVVSRAQDEEMTRVVEQLSFVNNADVQAISAVVLSAMSYMLLLSKNHRTMLGIDLSNEEGWMRIEEAVKTIYTAVGHLLVERQSGGGRELPPRAMIGAYW